MFFLILLEIIIVTLLLRALFPSQCVITISSSPILTFVQCNPFTACVVSNSNWTEWSTIQAVIGRVISKSAEREAQGRFEITSTIAP